MKQYLSEIREIKQISQNFKGKNNALSEELSHLTEANKDVVLLLYSRRSLEVLVRDICNTEEIKISDTIPLKGIIDKLNKEQKVPSNIITSMLNLNSSSVYGAHPKEFDTGQVRTALINLASILKWFIAFKENDDSSQPLSQPQPLPQSQPQSKKSIIVLPFENMSSDPEQEYFSDGLTEEIITDLSYIHDLLVISRSSAMTFKGSKKKISEISREVNVTHVLEGSVRKAGNRLRITAQLIEADTDTHIWAEKYDGVLDDIFDIQEKVAKSIANSLKIKLNQEEVSLIESTSIKNPKAYELFQKAKYEFYYFHEERLKRALQYMGKAMEIEGENPNLFFMKGLIFVNLLNVAKNLDTDYLIKAKDCASKVFELQPDSSLGYNLLGFVTFFDGNIKDAVQYLQKSYKKEPDDTFVLSFLVLGYFYIGNSEKACMAGEKLKELDPFNPINLILEALIHFMDNKKNEALSASEKAYTNFPEVPQVLLYYAYHLLVNNKNDEALLIFKKLTDSFAETIFEALGKLFICAIEGKQPDGIMSSEIEEKMRMDSEWLWLVADCYAMMNKKQEALDLIEHIINRGFINYPVLSEYDPFLSVVHNEVRFKQLMQKVKHEWENFKI